MSHVTNHYNRASDRSYIIWKSCCWWRIISNVDLLQFVTVAVKLLCHDAIKRMLLHAALCLFNHVLSSDRMWSIHDVCGSVRCTFLSARLFYASVCLSVRSLIIQRQCFARPLQSLHHWASSRRSYVASTRAPRAHETILLLSPGDDGLFRLCRLRWWYFVCRQHKQHDSQHTHTHYRDTKSVGHADKCEKQNGGLCIAC